MLHVLPTKRGRLEVAGLRQLRIVPRADGLLFAFTAPLGLVNPMARTHVRLLGPCFKTGLRGRRPTRQRDANRDRPSLAIRVRLTTRRVAHLKVAASKPTTHCRRSHRRMKVKPTLSQTWTRDKLASAICVQSINVHVSCSSHGISELAPFFIDPRAK